MDGLIFGACTVAGVLVTALCARRALHHPRVFTWLIAVAFGVCTVGVFFAVPAVAGAAEEVTGLDNAGKLVAHICAILWCAALQMTMVDLAYRPEYLRAAMYQRVCLAVVILAVMVPLFLATNGQDVEFTTAYADHSSVTAYLLVYLFYVLITCGELAFMCGRTARRARRPPLDRRRLHPVRARGRPGRRLHGVQGRTSSSTRSAAPGPSMPRRR